MSRFSIAVGKVQTDAVKEAFDAQEEEVNLLNRQYQRVILVIVVLSLAMSFLFASVNRLNSEYKQTRIELHGATDNVSNLIRELSTENDLRLQLEGSVQGLRDMLLIQQASTPIPTTVQILSVPQATAVPTATPTPTPAKPIPQYSINVYAEGLSLLGNGNYRFGVKVYLDPGSPFDIEMAKVRQGNIVRAFQEECPVDGRYFTSIGYNPPGGDFYASSEGGTKPVSDQCWSFLEKMTGMKPQAKLSASAVLKLQRYPAVNSYRTLFVSDEGRVLGVWQSSFPPMGKKCLDEGLRQVGYTGEPFFMIDPYTSDAFPMRVLRDEGFNAGWPVIPDLCSKGLLRSVAQPMWVVVSGTEDGGFRIYTKLHPGEPWGSEAKFIKDEITGKWWSWMNIYADQLGWRPVASFSETDLVAIPWGTSQTVGVFLRFEKNGLAWYQSDAGSYLKLEGMENKIASVYLYPFVDGTGPYVFSNPNPLPYKLGGEIITPPGAKYLK